MRHDSTYLCVFFSLLRHSSNESPTYYFPRSTVLIPRRYFGDDLRSLGLTSTVNYCLLFHWRTEALGWFRRKIGEGVGEQVFG